MLNPARGASSAAPEQPHGRAVVAVADDRVALIADVDAALDGAYAELDVLERRLRCMS